MGDEPLSAAGSLLAALAFAAAPAPPRAPAAADERGTYRLAGTARVDATPFDREVEVRADAVVRPGDGRQLRLRLVAQGHACEVTARVGEAGALTFAAGQVCPVALDEPELRGKVTARLRSGGGRIGGGRLALDLTFDLSGAVRLATERVQLFGAELSVPAELAPEVPVRGQARAVVEGTRDESRAGGG